MESDKYGYTPKRPLLGDPSGVIVNRPLDWTYTVNFESFYKENTEFVAILSIIAVESRGSKINAVKIKGSKINAVEIWGLA